MLSRHGFLPYLEFEIFCFRPQLVIVSALCAQEKQGRLTKKLITIIVVGSLFNSLGDLILPEFPFPYQINLPEFAIFTERCFF